MRPRKKRTFSRTPGWCWAALGVVVLGAFALRVYRLGEVPAGLFCDEAANGYNAYSLLHTGRDEHGTPFPLFIWSFFAFKYPLYIYPSMLWVGLFGLTEFATRLQAALYGTGTVFVAFLIGRRLFHPLAGLAAATVLCVLPWHIHFSRVAFALIGLPFWFGLGFYFLVGALEDGRRRDWILAAVCFAFCFYIYAATQVLLPAFLGVVLLLYAPTIWRQRRRAALALVVGFLVTLPFLIFYMRHVDRAGVYVGQTSVLAQPGTVGDKIDLIFERNWPTYYQSEFLLEKGDPILRHGVRNHGVLYPSLLPWIGVGILAAFARRGRATKLLLVWLALYPLAAVLTRETPSATRSILGTLVCALFAGAGFDGAVAIVQAFRWRWLRVALVGGLVGLAAIPLARETNQYLDQYFHQYPTYAAVGIEGFQYGYRDLFRLMEQRRDEVDGLYYSVTSVNNPYIFELFYVRRPPLQLSEWGSAVGNYRAVRPSELNQWYHPDRKILFAALPLDMWFFESWDERIDIRGPGGTLAFIVMRNPKPKRFIEQWELLGPFENPDNKNSRVDLVDPKTMEAKRAVVVGKTRWEPYLARHGVVELNRYLAARIPGSRNNPEFMISYLRATVRSPDERRRRLELIGSRDEMMAWLNGELLSPAPVMLEEMNTRVLDAPLRPGDNVLLLKTVETVGDWWYSARFARSDGSSDPQLEVEGIRRLEAGD